MLSKSATRSLAFAATLAFASASPVAPASAQGFFDQLFGGMSTPQQPASVDPSGPSFSDPNPGTFPGGAPYPRHHKKRVADMERAPAKQTPTDLMHDKTLHVGDAVMMKDGIHVYNGPAAGEHTKKQFVPLEDARHVSPTDRERLAAVDSSRNDQVSEARSSSDVVNGFKITDSHGNSVRYVGP